MLSCQQCEKYLPAFLDHALGVKESLDIEEHLLQCESCTNRAEAERALRHFVRIHAVAPPVPEEFKRRIIQQAITPPRRLAWPLFPLMRFHLRDAMIGVTAAAAALVLVLGISWLQSPPDGLAQQFLRESSIAYGAYSGQDFPLDVASADDMLVTRWFKTRMGDQLPVPCITDKSTQLLGGRLCRFLDRKSAVLKYQRHGVDILLFAFKDNQLALPPHEMVHTNAGSFYVQHVIGRPVALWQRNGITYAMVGDMDREALLQVAATLSYR
jgi:anti-sigma factor RsiW